MNKQAIPSLILFGLCAIVVGAQAIRADTAGVPGGRKVAADLAFKTHLDIGRTAQDLLIERAAGAN